MLLELIVREQLGLICKFDLVKRANQMEHLKVRPQLHSPLPSRISVMYSKSVSTCRVFALIIGIDEYKHSEIPNLRGSVHDAYAMKAYLSDGLEVPDSHIFFLSNTAATRDGIITSFWRDLINNESIEDGDTIIIFYAGHGSRASAPTGWIAADGQIETILPHDVGTRDPEGEQISPIPDCTINELLRKLATAKGNNITVIFDCCNSGGLARTDAQRTVRFAEFPHPIPETLDDNILPPELARNGRRKMAGFRYDAMSSHVLLAACRQDENAYEDTSAGGLVRGAFTKSIIHELSQLKRLDQITNSDLIDSLTLTKQHPQCEGTHKNRIVFNGKLVGRPPKAFRLIGRPNGTFEVDAGHLQGVVCGTEFVVQDYNTESSSRQGLGILVADKVNADSSILVVRRGEAKFPVPERATALVLNWNNELKVFVHADSRQQVDPYTTPLPSEVDASQSRLVAPQDFVFVGSQFEADISIRLTPSAELHIERLNDLIPRYASRMTCIALDNEFGRLPLTLNAIAHFKHHLGRHHGADPLWKVSRNAYDPLKGVTMELYRLTRNAGFRVPDPSFGNLLIDNKASLPQDNEAEYGIAIINRSEHSLYPYLFYFDPSDYRIESWYSPPARAMEPPLRPLVGSYPGGVTVGYGAGGGDAIEFSLKPGERSDTGFLKLFVSTTSVDMECLEQMFPFDSVKRGGRRKTRQPGDDSIWGAWVAAIRVSGCSKI